MTAETGHLFWPQRTHQYVLVAEKRLAGGYVGGQCGQGTRFAARPVPHVAVHALLAHLADKGFTAAPRPLGFDEQGREVLTFLEGETIGIRRPRPGLGSRRRHP